ncbi:MAG: hypothetical protein NC121_12030 [Blautia sp.]|nr:hypothetical protein [Blautia sp.]
MKKLLFGCFLMLSGIIGGSAWLIAASNLVQDGAWSTMANIFPVIGFGRKDGYFVILFYALAVAGAVIAIKGMKEDK